MTTEEIRNALVDFAREAGESGPVGFGTGSSGFAADSTAPATPEFEIVNPSSLADSAADPKPQGSSLDMDALKAAESERQQAEDLLRSIRGRTSRQPQSDAAFSQAVTSEKVEQMPEGIAIRVNPVNSQRRDAPGIGPRVQILNNVTKKVTFTQG